MAMGYVLWNGQEIGQVYNGTDLPNSSYSADGVFIPYLKALERLCHTGAEKIMTVSLPASEEKFKVIKKDWRRILLKTVVSAD